MVIDQADKIDKSVCNNINITNSLDLGLFIPIKKYYEYSFKTT